MDSREDSDGDLLLCMSWRGEDPQGADAAFAEFYERHAKYLFAVCLRSYATQIGRPGVEDLVQMTFWQAFERAGQFENEDGLDQDQARRRVRGWLGTIANRLFLDQLKAEKRRFRLVTGEDEQINLAESRESPVRTLSRDDELVRRGLREVLNDRERAVVEAYSMYYDPERDLQRPPDGVVEELCRLLDTTAENLRQLRVRSLRKLKEFIEAERARSERTTPDAPRQEQRQATTGR